MKIISTEEYSQAIDCMNNANEALKELKLKNDKLESEQVKNNLVKPDVSGVFAFAEWISDIGMKQYKEGWCEYGGSNGWHCTTEQLYDKFKEAKTNELIDNN